MKKETLNRFLGVIASVVLLFLIAALTVVHGQNTPHSATYTVTGSGTGLTGFNCYKGSSSGGPYAKFATATLAAPNCIDTAPGSAGTRTFYVATAVAGANESGFSNEVSGVAVGNPNPPTAGAVSEQ